MNINNTLLLSRMSDLKEVLEEKLELDVDMITEERFMIDYSDLLYHIPVPNDYWLPTITIDPEEVEPQYDSTNQEQQK